VLGCVYFAGGTEIGGSVLSKVDVDLCYNFPYFSPFGSVAVLNGPCGGVQPVLREVSLFRGKFFDKLVSELHSESIGSTLVRVQGAPGIGKSLSVWAWAVGESVRNPLLEVVYAKFFKQLLTRVVRIRGGRIVESSNNMSAHGPEGVTLLHAIVPRDLLIADGVVNEIDQLLIPLFKGYIAVQSGSCRMSGEACEMHMDMLTFNCDSWNEDDYKAALTPEGLAQGVVAQGVMKADCARLSCTANEWMEKKYFYCGGSARFMFQFDLEYSVRIIENALRAVADLKQLLSMSQLSTATATVSTIVQSFGDAYYLLSEFVCRKVAFLCSPSREFVHESKNLARILGRGYLGWIHELDAFRSLSRSLNGGALVLELVGVNPCERVSASIRCKKTHLIRREETALPVSLESRVELIFPEAHDQGCYDMAVVMYEHPSLPGRKVLLTVQATVSKQHGAKWDNVTQLLQAVASPSQRVSRDSSAVRSGCFSDVVVWHVFLLESEEQFETFKFPSAAPFVGIPCTRQTAGWEVGVSMWKALLPQQCDL